MVQYILFALCTYELGVVIKMEFDASNKKERIYSCLLWTHSSLPEGGKHSVIDGDIYYEQDLSDKKNKFSRAEKFCSESKYLFKYISDIYKRVKLHEQPFCSFKGQ